MTASWSMWQHCTSVFLNKLVCSLWPIHKSSGAAKQAHISQIGKDFLLGRMQSRWAALTLFTGREEEKGSVLKDARAKFTLQQLCIKWTVVVWRNAFSWDIQLTQMKYYVNRKNKLSCQLNQILSPVWLDAVPINLLLHQTLNFSFVLHT